jgi:hypothetical protein
MDVLIGNLVQGAIDWDKKDNWKKKKSGHQSIHVNHLVEVIRSCGVTFNIWEKVNADKQGSGLYDFTSLLGRVYFNVQFYTKCAVLNPFVQFLKLKCAVTKLTKI